MKTASRGPHLYETMRTEDFSFVVATMLQNKTAKNEVEAEALVDAFLQWAALVPSIEPGKLYIMLNTPVDDAFHAFLEHAERYERFCKTHLGFVVQHHPVEAHVGLDLGAGVQYTLDLLEERYGAGLHPALKDWRAQVEAGCSVVSCSACDSVDLKGKTVLAALPNGATLMH